jgi:hypothetical protein
MVDGPLEIFESKNCDDVATAMPRVASRETHGPNLVVTYELSRDPRCSLEFHLPRYGSANPIYERFMYYDVLVGGHQLYDLGRDKNR